MRRIEIGMTQKAACLFALLRLGIGTSKASDGDYSALLGLNLAQWRELMTMAETQGVAAIAFDGVQELYKIYQKNIVAAKDTTAEWMQWVFECTGMMTQYEQRCQQQKKVIAELSDFFCKEDIKMMVFKGQANASLYPIPEHRATGDIDCWLFGEAQLGDDILALHGASIDNRWYRHSKISFRGETIENHRVMGHTRSSKQRKRMEEELRLMVKGSGLAAIEGCGKALMPSAQFNACFLTYHALHHFTSEGLRMKQILDWAVFLQTQQDKVDWGAFDDFCKRYKLDRFAVVMNFIAEHYLGVECHTEGLAMDGTYAEKVINNTLFDDDYLFNSGKGDWAVRWLLVKNKLGRDRWKYEDIAQENVWKSLWRSGIGFLFKRDEEE